MNWSCAFSSIEFRDNVFPGRNQIKNLFVFAALTMFLSVAGRADDENERSPASVGFSPECIVEEREALSKRVRDYLITLMHEPREGEPWGLFKYCVDVDRPWSIVATDDAWAMSGWIGGIEALPGYHSKAKEEMAAFIQQFQDAKTGFFRDPHLDRTFGEKDSAVPLPYRRAVTKYAVTLLSLCDAKPLYPFSLSTGQESSFDGKAYLKSVQRGNWNKPWGIGSHTALAAVEGFTLICDGRDDLIPVVKEGIEGILSHQNPDTGMWGPTTISLDQQIGGALKVISRFQSHMGFIVPHMDKLADSIIENHDSGEFYDRPSCASVPRNVAFMTHACLVASDYRRQELRNVLWEIAADEFECFHEADGGYSYMPDGRSAKNWCGAVAVGKSREPRSDVHGTINAAQAILQIYRWLESTEDDTERLIWQEKWRDLKYKVVLDGDDKVSITPR